LALTGYIRIVPEKETFGDKFFFGFLNANIRFLNNVVKRGEAVGKFQMMRRDAFQRVGGFREDLVTREDGDIFMRIARIGRTKCDPSLIVFHEGRRAHAVGWIKLLFIWSMNTIWVLLFDKAFSKEWKPVR
jgi:GT2 family glycosyltransferase